MSFQLSDIRQAFRATASMVTQVIKKTVPVLLIGAALAGCTYRGVFTPKSLIPPSQAELAVQPKASFVCGSQVGPSVAQSKSELGWTTHTIYSNSFNEVTFTDHGIIRVNGSVAGNPTSPQVKVTSISFDQEPYGSLRLDTTRPLRSTEDQAYATAAQQRAAQAVQTIAQYCWSGVSLPQDFIGLAQDPWNPSSHLWVQLGNSYNCNVTRSSINCFDNARGVRVDGSFSHSYVGGRFTRRTGQVSETYDTVFGETWVNLPGKSEHFFADRPSPDMEEELGNVRRAMQVAYPFIRYSY
ncbi:MAG: hypothetical protein SFW62_01215 [Alphaproteobacteria bacterium]|nr:hypothetical protein [Alphaproteobacteria bacterium]